MMKRIVTTIMAIAMVITMLPTTIVKAESVQEEYVDIVNPALIEMKTVRGPMKIYSPNNYFQNLAAKNLYAPMPGEQYQDTVQSDYPEEKTYYYIASKFDQNKLNINDPDELAKLTDPNSKFSSTSYDKIAGLEEAKQTVSYRFFKEYLADDKCTVWDKVVSQVALGVENKNSIIDLYTQTNLAGFCNIYKPTKTYYYTAFTCKHSNCGYDSDTDPYGYHIIHTFLTLYDFYADHDSSVSDITTYTPYTDACQGWSSRSPIYTHIKDFDHPTEVEPLNNYYYTTATNYCQDLNYVILKRAYLASTEVYKGEPRCPEAYESVKYRQENPLESLSPAPNDVPTSTTPEVVNVESVSLSTSSITMNVGDTKAITYTVVPSDATNKEVGWTSSNKSIAYYKDGSIIAKNAGVATITVTTKSGNRKASVVVNVVGKTEDVVEDSDDYNVDTKTNTATCDKVLVRNGVATIPDMVVVNGKKVKVTSVSSKAFKNPASVTTIVFGKNVTLVSGSFAKFKNLRSVTFKSTKIKVGKNSFKTCKKLKTIKFTNKKVTKVTLGKNAFSKKTKLSIQCKSKSAKKAIKKTFRGYKYKI